MSLVMNPERMQFVNGAKRRPLTVRWSMAVVAMLATWDANWRARQHLKAMPAHMLNDIGLDPMTAHAEVSKPFWQA